MSHRIAIAAATLLVALPLVPLAAAEGTPDLETFVWIVGDAEPDAPFTLQATIVNWETTDVGAFGWRLLIDDLVVHEATSDGLSAFEFDEHAIPAAGLAAGWHRLRIEADPAGEIVETYEDNNVHELVILFSTEHPDLRTEILDVRAAGGLDNVVDVDWRVCNEGTLSTLSGVFVDSSMIPSTSFLQTHFAPFGTARIGAIDAGACATGTFRRATGDNVGEHTLLVGAGHGLPAAFERMADRDDNHASRRVTLVPLVGRI